MPKQTLFWRDRYNTALRPEIPSRAQRWREMQRIVGDIAQMIDQVVGAHMLDDPRAEIVDIKLGALEAHVVLAHGKVNDIAVALDGLKGGDDEQHN